MGTGSFEGTWCFVFARSGRIATAAVVVLGAVVLGAGLAGRQQLLPLPADFETAPPPAPVPVATLSFDAALTEAATLPRIRSLLVAVDGTLVAEQYFHGAAAGRTTNIKSASKSNVSLLVGIAIDRGLIKSVHEPISRYLQAEVGRDPVKAGITIEDLLTMRTGLETTSNRNYGRWVMSPNWVRFVLQQPMEDEPGGRMIYSTGSTHLLSAILTRATRTSTLEFARSVLATPLGFTLSAWPRDPQGIYLGGNEMPMRPRDMLRIGELYLNGGRYDQRQIVSSGWIQESIVPRTTSRWSERQYGYGWWIRTLAGTPVFYAWGYGGQFIFVAPSVRTVVVVTSVVEPGSERRDHLDAVYDLVERHVIAIARTAFPDAE
jgi:CubicO group peptidase (beta-lactamase class C family)